MLLKSTLLVLISAFVVSCSQTKMAVNWADTFLAWEVNDVFDLNSDQKKQVRPEINEALKVTKKEMFPKYANVLMDAKAQLMSIDDQPKAEATVATLVEQLNQAVEESFKKVKPQIVNISQKLNFKNWEEFKDDFEDRTEDIEEDSRKPSKKFEKRVEDWVGSINESQKKSIVEFQKSHPFPAAERVKNRRETMAKFEAQAEITATALNKEKLAIAVGAVVDDYQSYQTASYNKAVTEYRDHLKKFLAQFYMSLDQKQKEKLFANIDKRAKEFNEMAVE